MVFFFLYVTNKRISKSVNSFKDLVFFTHEMTILSVVALNDAILFQLGSLFREISVLTRNQNK
jgi:hypothetical protein